MPYVLPLLFVLIALVVWGVLEFRRRPPASECLLSSQEKEALREASRDIRTSMNAMLGFAEILSGPSVRRTTEAERKEIVEILARNCDQVLEMVNRLLENKGVVVENETGRVTQVKGIERHSPSLTAAKIASNSSNERLKTVLQQMIALQPVARDEETIEKPLSDYRVLIVEDTAINQLLTAYQLREMGAEVDVAENGKLGIDRIRQEENDHRYYDLVVMDMQMPVMDGYEATRQLRASGFLRPILALTSNALPGDREKTIDAGCNDYLSRPATPKDLLDHIQTLLFTFREEPGGGI